MKKPAINERTCADGALSFKMMLMMIGVFARLALMLPAADPGWWGPGSGDALNYSTTTNNEVVVNQGQVHSGHSSECAVALCCRGD